MGKENKTYFPSDRAARLFFILALAYLLLGLLFGFIGALQYLLPGFLKEQLSFQKTRPLHVYLVISWIFTAAQAGIYYYLPRVANKPLIWKRGIWLHLFVQVFLSVMIVILFLYGKFGGREYLEFPPHVGLLILLSWLPFAINYFFTLKPDYSTAPVYVWMWSTGLLFFFITLSENYLWIVDYFRTNIIRDLTVQWKATGSLVGSWNMLVYGTGMYVMEKISGDKKPSRSSLAFFFYFLGLINLMFNWGHHTYLVPAAPWVKTVSFLNSMTELLILARIIRNFKKSISESVKNFHKLPYRFLLFADGWIFLNLVLALLISVPAWNAYTHGTHITVAHAMGTTIGINTMLLFASVYYVLLNENPAYLELHKKQIGLSIYFVNGSLLVFWISLLLSGMVKIAGKLHSGSFYEIMKKSHPWFQAFTVSGFFVLAGLGVLSMLAVRLLWSGRFNSALKVFSPAEMKLTKIIPEND